MSRRLVERPAFRELCASLLSNLRELVGLQTRQAERERKAEADAPKPKEPEAA